MTDARAAQLVDAGLIEVAPKNYTPVTVRVRGTDAAPGSEG
ncbi:hypothetical protein PE067_08510 [Paracoccus sp. DMF-8]|nr:hypothetical protein [Paracoccus sp. DMF-8]MDF3606167.1 hypothetical protein [Paracoccus sp. DMF-8]